MAEVHKTKLNARLRTLIQISMSAIFCMIFSHSIYSIQIEQDEDSASDKAPPLSVQPVVHTASWAIDWWLPRHEQKLQEIQQRGHDIDLVFLGDSITHNWESKGKIYWQDFYGSRKALNLGFGGDRTEHVLWRLQNGELDGLNPRLLVLMIGTNNTGHRQDPAEDTVLGIKMILDEIKTRLPDTKILLMAIFPRSATKDDPLRQLNEKINKQIKPLADNQRIFWLNINHMFLNEDGSLPNMVMNDLLHPESEQYKRWAEAIEPYVVRFVDKYNENEK